MQVATPVKISENGSGGRCKESAENGGLKASSLLWRSAREEECCQQLAVQELEVFKGWAPCRKVTTAALLAAGWC